MIRVYRHALIGLLVTGAALSSVAPALAAKDKKADAADAASKFNLSKPVQNAIAAAQAAIAKQDWATASAQLAIADAALSTDDDRYVSAIEHVQVAQATQDVATELKALQYLVTSARATNDQKVQYLTIEMQIAARQKDAAGEQAAAQQLVALAPDNPDNYIVLADLYGDQKNYPQALAATEKAADLQRAANKPIDPAVAHNLFAYSFNAHNAAAISKYGPVLVASDPSAASWKLVFEVLRTQPGLDDQARLDLDRLMRETGGFADGNDYLAYADLAGRHGLPGEAVSAIDLAQSKGVTLDQRDATEVRSTAAAKVATDKAGLNSAEASARGAPTGRPALGVADGYLSYGQYQKAADLYGVAIQKGGVDASTAQIRRGIALVHLGQKAEAKAAFAQVTGPRATIASYWSIWSDHSS